ncbi:hypothetical protein [Bacteroides fluxus]|jgi:hypothetical protein|uniref:hypothetical protein n=1 Tax=Bacteroides fluxus TaxID=626930 RepID=UPI00235589F5|nr:hypothetical protein [Bacteroides fluxus]
MIMPNPSIEQIFSAKNIDQDCTLIAELMTPFQNQISSALSSGDHVPAIELFLQLLASTAVHFVKDEHWCYFDDYYSPDYLCMTVFDSFKEAMNAGKFLPEEMKMLRDGLLEIASLKAVQDYGYPSVERWLKNDCFYFS